MLSEADILLEVSRFLNEEIKKAFGEQGHHLTGGWEKSLYASANGGENVVTGYAANYGAFVDAGVTAENIPFGGNGYHGTGGVGIKTDSDGNESYHPTSKYIQGLVRFWKLRKPGISDKEALSLAFATAKVQKKQGMSTWNSRDYSANKERQFFIGQAFSESEREVNDMVFSGLSEVVNENFVEEKEIVY